MWRISTISSIVWVLLFASDGQTGHCKQNICAIQKQAVVVQKVQKVVAAPVYSAVPTVVNYFVGAPIRAQAMMEYEMKNNPEWQAFQEWKTNHGQLDSQESSAPPTPPNPPSVLATTCLKCHGAEPRDNNLSLTDVRMTRQLRDRIIERVTKGEMPPNQPLSPETFGAFQYEMYHNFPIEDDPDPSEQWSQRRERLQEELTPSIERGREDQRSKAEKWRKEKAELERKLEELEEDVPEEEYPPEWRKQVPEEELPTPPQNKEV